MRAASPPRPLQVRCSQAAALNQLTAPAPAALIPRVPGCHQAPTQEEQNRAHPQGRAHQGEGWENIFMYVSLVFV